MKLQDDGTIDYRNALGLSGNVYITIPANRLEKGKVNLMLQGHYMELEAEFSNEIISALNLNLDDYLPKKSAFTSAITQETLSLVPTVKG